MHNYIILLSDLSYGVGLIGLAEYRERRAIADWLSPSGDNQPDPRDTQNEGESRNPEEHDETPLVRGDPSKGGAGTSSSKDDPTGRWPQFLAFNTWLFTIGDADCYPSVPHGHMHRKTNEWPKLNPYTGRVFSDVHAEDTGSRLSKSKMKKLWNDDNFVEFCRKHVEWYSDFAPTYDFPTARFGKLTFPKW